MKNLEFLVAMFFALALFGCSKEEGCTYPAACNFNEEAAVDDGSCDFATCAGCTDPDALNYDASATMDDGSCEYDPAATTAECVSSVDFDDYLTPLLPRRSVLVWGESSLHGLPRWHHNPRRNSCQFSEFDHPCKVNLQQLDFVFNAQDTFTMASQQRHRKTEGCAPRLACSDGARFDGIGILLGCGGLRQTHGRGFEI